VKFTVRDYSQMGSDNFKRMVAFGWFKGLVVEKVFAELFCSLNPFVGWKISNHPI
jgi:hypothetical protein